MSDVQERWEQLAQPRMVGLRELRGCYVRLGWFREQRLFLADYEDGRRELVYPVYAARESVVYVTVERVR